MSRPAAMRLAMVAVLVPVVVVAALLLGRWSGSDGDGNAGVAMVSDVDDASTFEHDYLIPPGTAERIAAGEDVEIVPVELVVQVGDAIRIVNDDTEGHVVGVFYVGAGETLTQRFERAGVLEGECSVHPSGSFTLRVVEA